MPFVIFVVIVVLACVAGWIYGEAKDNRAVRIASTLALVMSFSSIAAIVSGISTALSVGIPTSTAVHEYLDASAAQLAAGNTAFVINEFDGFKTRAHVTYETGGFVDAVQRETARMKRGP